MALGNLRAIGPIVVDYRNPALSWKSEPSTHGIRPCTISGTVLMAQGHALAELVANPDARTTIGGFTGVLEFIEMDGDALASCEGYYLLQSLDLNIDRQFVYGGRAPFTLAAAYLGDLG